MIASPHLDWDALDRVRAGEGTADERKHLSACAACRAELDEIARLAAAVKRDVARASDSIPAAREDAILAAARSRAAAIRSGKLVRLAWWKRPGPLALAASMMVAAGAGYLTYLQRNPSWSEHTPVRTSNDAIALPAASSPASVSAPAAAPAPAADTARPPEQRKQAESKLSEASEKSAELRAKQAPAGGAHLEQRLADTKVASKELANAPGAGGSVVDELARAPEPVKQNEALDRPTTLPFEAAGKDEANAVADASKGRQQMPSAKPAPVEPAYERPELDAQASRAPAPAPASASSSGPSAREEPAPAAPVATGLVDGDSRASSASGGPAPIARDAKSRETGEIAAGAAAPQRAPRAAAEAGDLGSALAKRDAAGGGAAHALARPERVDVVYRLGATVTRTIRQTYRSISTGTAAVGFEAPLAPGERALGLELVEPERRTWPAAADGSARWQALDLPAGRVVLEVPVAPRPASPEGAGPFTLVVPIPDADSVAIELTPEPGFEIARPDAIPVPIEARRSEEGGWHLSFAAGTHAATLTLRVVVTRVR